jgi:transcriptional regulator with XRE-family HTH domain
MELSMSPLKLAILKSRVHQTRMAIDLGWDPAKLSRIVNGIVLPNSAEKTAIANRLNVPEDSLFPDDRQAASKGLS